jgi:HK97 gp10 family phage protein
MRAGGGVEIRGLKQLRDKLRRVSAVMRSQIMTNILVNGADIVRDAAIMKCPTDTGTLRESIRIAIEPTGRGGSKVMVIAGEGFYTGDQWYAGPVEYGHFTGKRKGRKGHDEEKYHQKQIAAGRKWVAPRPFMRPAADENYQQVLNVIIGGVEMAIAGAVT